MYIKASGLINYSWCVVIRFVKMCGILVYIRIIPSSFVPKFIKAHSGKFIQNPKYSSQVYHLWGVCWLSLYWHNCVLVTHTHTSMISYCYHAHHLLKMYCTTEGKIDRLLITWCIVKGQHHASCYYTVQSIIAMCWVWALQHAEFSARLSVAIIAGGDEKCLKLLFT